MISKKLTGLLLAVIIILGLLVRVYALSKAPPSLYWDEMDVGYQAYSILKTGKDYFGNQPFLTVHSFADFRAPLLIYLTIPFVALIGLSSVSVRLPAAILGTLTILLIFILVNLLFKDRKTALFAAALTAFAPWEIQYSRMAFEAILLLVLFLGGLIFFFKGLINPKWFILASILFSINLFTYNTAKLFEPITLFILGVIYFPNLRKILFTRNLIISVVIFSITFLASLYGTVFLNGGQRFSEISVFTDPQTSSQIDFLRQESRSAYDETTLLGEQPRFLDKLIYNKITFQLDRVIQNYFQVFSTEFLFIKGDPNLRHSTSYTGEFYRIEILTMIAGIIFLLFNFKKDKQKTLFLFAWIITAPLAAIVTREGGNHASRLFLLFPVLTIVSSLGLKQIYEMTFTKLKFFPLNKIIFSGIALIWIFGVISFLNFYFGAYKLSSERAFQYGFNEAVTKAIESKNSYDYVVMDNKGDTALMNYLFVSKYDPNLFQKNLPNMKSRFFDFDADQIDNIVMLKPGARNWEIIFNINLIDKDYLLIISAEQLEEQSPEKVNKKLTTNQKLLDVIRYKSGEPAFYVISSHKEIAI